MPTRAPSDGSLSKPIEKQHCSCYCCQLKKTNVGQREKRQMWEGAGVGEKKSIKADPDKRGVSEFMQPGICAAICR
jgi:hypothetical protein